MIRQHRRYDDKFRASAVVILEAAGYPDRKGALEQVSTHLNVPPPTLHRWFHAKNNPPPSEIVSEKRFDLIEAIKNELRAAFSATSEARPDAGYQTLITSIAILIDKLQLLEGKPTWRGEIVNLLKDGSITPQDVLNELGDAPELAEELFNAAGLQFAGIRKT